MSDITDGLIESKLTADEQFFLQLYEQYRIKAASKYAEKEYLLEREGIGFSPRGNVCALTAEKKAGKSWFSMSMCAAYLRGEYLGMKARVPECHTPHVLYFDTEQDEGDGQRIQRRVHYACGLDFEQDNDKFQIFHLREIPADERRKFIINAITFLPCDLVIVDGIRDLLSDFNDLEQSASVIQDFMRLSSQKQCCIWTILHVNPNSEKMRGHLGTELGNKVADILFMTKTKDSNNDDCIYKMEETASRGHKDIRSITFRIDDNAPFGMPVLVSKEEVEQIDENRVNELRTIMQKYIPTNASWSKTKIKESLIKGEHIGASKAWKMIEEAMRLGVLVEYLDKLSISKQTQSDMPF